MHKFEAMKEGFRAREKMAVLFSGGLDSTLLARLAYDVLENSVRALTFFTPIIHQEEAAEARMLAELIGIPCDVIAIDEMEEDPAFSLNQPDRCYTCRKIRNRAARSWADTQGIALIADGMNASDLKDYRPGIRASREDGIWQPFVEFGITKDEIREHSRELGLPTWEKPNTVCLCSRIPFGMEITRERLRRVEEAESFLKRLGFAVCRVRYFPLETAVVEIEDMGKALTYKELIVSTLRDMGFLFVTLDLEGFSSGKLNRSIKQDRKASCES
jgi:uncharacterized protein